MERDRQTGKLRRGHKEAERGEEREKRYLVVITESERQTDKKIETCMKRGRERGGEGKRDKIHCWEDRVCV